MILGDVCTRGCRFCSVATGKPVFSPSQFQAEAERVAEAALVLKLRHVVLTSVARDDLEDGGASGFCRAIDALREKISGVTIEVLIPDFRGALAPLQAIIESAPDILNHNLETVPRLYRRVRPGASYQGSLRLLSQARKMRPGIQTKTGIMLGLGERESEVQQLMQDSRDVGVDIFTAGQYMRPTKDHLPVSEYLLPERFEQYRLHAKDCGFPHVAIGPLVRSSYHAEDYASV